MMDGWNSNRNNQKNGLLTSFVKRATVARKTAMDSLARYVQGFINQSIPKCRTGRPAGSHMRVDTMDPIRIKLAGE